MTGAAMAKFDIFSFCMCKKVATSPKIGLKENLPESPLRGRSVHSNIVKSDVAPDKEQLKQNAVHHHEWQSVTEPKTNLQRSSSVPTKKAVKFDLGNQSDILHYPNGNVDFSWLKATGGVDESKSLHELVRKKRVEVRKAHGKLKIDLKNIQKMREQLDSRKTVSNANLPDVVATDANFSDSDFLREFRQLFDGAMAEISTPTSELQELSDRYRSLLGVASTNDKDSDDLKHGTPDDESRKVAQDSERILQMLRKAMKVATIEHSLKVSLSDKRSSSPQSIEDLESALLGLQRLRSSDGLEFSTPNDDSLTHSHSGGEGATCTSVRLIFGEIFSTSHILRIERDAKLRLAEMHIDALDLKHRQNDARFQLNQALEKKREPDIKAAIIAAKNAKLSSTDSALSEAEKTLNELTYEVETCRERLKNAIGCSSVEMIKKELKRTDSLKIPENDPAVMEAKRVLEVLQDKDEQIKRFTNDLKKAMKKKNADEIQDALVSIKSTRVSTETKIVEEATNLLIHLRKSDQDTHKHQAESIRLRLIELIHTDNFTEIAGTLVRAQSVGLSNCVEIMGAKAKLVQLQNEKESYHIEIQKVEAYLEKLVSKAEESSVTVDIIKTMERAIAVTNCLDVSPQLKQQASKSLDSLNIKKDKVKTVKDDLQRAVMECRQEAITCAIAEAESLPYFLTFDPLDGQISAILEYARNKIAPHNSPSITGDGRSPVQRVKSNLKRAMRGNSASKLESAIALYRKTYSIPEKQEYPDSGELRTDEDEENAALIRRAERRCRRMKRQERVAEREWKQTRNMLRENLRSSMKEKDRAELWKAVYQFKRKMGSSLDKDDETLLQEARKHLREVTIQQVKTNLSSALVDRDSTRLQHSLGELDSPSLTMYPISTDVNFRGEITKAKKLLGHLKEMDRLRKSVSEMSRSQLAEIHRYPSPPACVRAVMTATYMLLGENEKDLKDWTAVMRLLVKMGRESLTRRVAVCAPSHILFGSAHRVEVLLSDWTLQQVQDVSKGAAVFFAWSKCMVSEVLDRQQHGEKQPKQTRPSAKPKETPKDPVKSEFWNRLSRPRSSVPAGRPLRAFRMNNLRPTSAMK